MNEAKKECIDILNANLGEKLLFYPCQYNGGNQFFAFAENGQIITSEDSCVGIKNRTVILTNCSENDRSQLWTFDVAASKF